jgi:RIO kinase 1
MQLIGDDRAVAPRLVDARLDVSQVRAAHAQLREELVLLTRGGLVHADLSPYNALWWEGRVWIIDLPQAVDLATNLEAFDLLHHDVVTMATWCTRQGVQVDGEGWFGELLGEAL